MRKSNDSSDVIGASKALRKTTKEIMKFLKDDGKQPAHDLRPFLYEKLADSNERWFRRGFNRGHKESFRVFEKRGKVPITLTYEGERELFTGDKRPLNLKSTVRK